MVLRGGCTNKTQHKNNRERLQERPCAVGIAVGYKVAQSVRVVVEGS